jgi:hypothetical protein
MTGGKNGGRAGTGTKGAASAAAEEEGLASKIDKNHAELMSLLRPQGKKIKKITSDIGVLSKVQKSVILENREEWYKFWVESKFSSNASLIFSRPSSCAQAPATLDRLRPLVDSCFPRGGPPYVFEPLGKNGTFKLIPCTFSPMESRSICASVIQAAKEAVRKAFGLNIHYDNCFRLRQIRSRAQKLVAKFLQDCKLSMNGRATFPKGVLHINGIGLFPEYLVPADEDWWPECYEFIEPAFESLVASGAFEDKTEYGRFYDGMADVYVRSRGLDDDVGTYEGDPGEGDASEDEDDTMTGDGAT